MLAADLALSRSVVVEAYDQLVTEGYLEARQGSGTRVRAQGDEDFATEGLGQLTLARFIDGGGFARHLRRVRPVYRARRDRLLAALAAHLPEIRPDGGAAGLHLLLRLPPGLDPGAFADAAARHGIMLEETAQHWADPREAPPAVLIGYGTLRESTIANGIEALAADLKSR